MPISIDKPCYENWCCKVLDISLQLVSIHMGNPIFNAIQSDGYLKRL
jgi:hypothetical protein